MCGKVNGPMTEQTPYAPTSKKGEIRARIATALMEEVKAGRLTAMIARAADFTVLRQFRIYGQSGKIEVGFCANCTEAVPGNVDRTVIT